MNRRHFDFDTKQMVKNPNEDQYVYENRIPAIVSKELWERANREIDKRAGKKTVGINPGKHILSGKLVCGLCGAPFYRTTRKRKHDQICQWKCRTYLEQGRTKPGKEGGCDNIHLEENGLFSFLAIHILLTAVAVKQKSTGKNLSKASKRACRKPGKRTGTLPAIPSKAPPAAVPSPGKIFRRSH